MQDILRYSLVVFLATAMTISPAFAVHTMDCGCHSPEPVYDSACGCSCSGHAHVVSAVPSCCEETLTHEAQPAEAEELYPQPAQSEPDDVENLTPLEKIEPEPSVMPKADSPIAAETPAWQPVVPERDHLDDLFEAPPVTDTSNTEPEPEPEMPPVEETPVQPEPDPVDRLFTPPATDPSPAEEVKENDAEPAEEDDPLDDLFSEVRRPDALSIPGGLESGANRTWTDNTVKYHCEARLLGVAQGKIVLAKAAGGISHVSLRRLSDRDLSFVYQQVVAKRELLARQATTEQLASVWSE